MKQKLRITSVRRHVLEGSVPKSQRTNIIFKNTRQIQEKDIFHSEKNNMWIVEEKVENDEGYKICNVSQARRVHFIDSSFENTRIWVNKEEKYRFYVFEAK